VPRGFKKDVTTTKVLRANGLLLDKRSFISLGAEAHLLLKGDDIVCQRQRVAHRTKGRCGICRKPMEIFGPSADWEMDHKKNKPAERCDCLHNLRAVHPDCHRRRHPQTQFLRKTEAGKQFDEIYPESA
jgi:hypothetical protein